MKKDHDFCLIDLFMKSNWGQYQQTVQVAVASNDKAINCQILIRFELMNGQINESTYDLFSDLPCHLMNDSNHDYQNDSLTRRYKV